MSPVASPGRRLRAAREDVEACGMTEVFVSLADIYGVDNGSQLSWMDHGRCAEVDPELHFPERGGSTREAKKACQACDVRAECLEYALQHPDLKGIWGGTSELERRRYHRRAAA